MKKIILLMLIIIITGCQVDDKPKFAVNDYTGEINSDGWVEYFSIYGGKDSNNNLDLNQELNYFFDGINLKYKKIDGYFIAVHEGNKIVSQIEPSVPTYSVSSKCKNEILNIDNYFDEKQFKTNIDVNDLNDLEIKCFDKNNIVDLFNKAITSETLKLGEYGSLPQTDNISYIDELGVKYQITYIALYGQIRKIHFEIIKNDEYLSDKVKNKKCTQKDKDLYNRLINIEKYIMDNQDFNITKSKDYDNDLEYFNYLIKNKIINND